MGSRSSSPVNSYREASPSRGSFDWDAASAMRKLASGSDFTVDIGIASYTKHTSPNNDERDAYRNCSNCHKHVNYHKNDKCPK